MSGQEAVGHGGQSPAVPGGTLRNGLVAWWRSEAGNVGRAKVATACCLPWTGELTATWAQRPSQARAGVKYGHLIAVTSLVGAPPLVRL